MAPDHPQPDTPTAGTPNPGIDKVRIHFRKAGPLRFLSHHDLMRAWLRMLRRAELPVRRTQGFHPHPRLVFALSLPLGVVGSREVADLELNASGWTEQEIQDRLAAQAPPGLDILQVRRIPPRTRIQVRGLCYAVTVPPERTAGLDSRIAEVLAAASCPVRRARPGKPARTVDLRPFLRDLRLTWNQQGDGEDLPARHDPAKNGRSAWLEMELNLIETGTARPEEVLDLLGLKDLLHTSVLERTHLELEERVPNDSPSGDHGPSELPATAQSSQGPTEARPA